MNEQTIGAVVEQTGISRSTLLQAAQQGRIPARQSGRYWLIDVESGKYRQWLKDHWQQARVKGKQKGNE